MLGEKQIKSMIIKMIKMLKDDGDLMREMYGVFMSDIHVEKVKVDGGIDIIVTNGGEEFMRFDVRKEDFE